MEEENKYQSDFENGTPSSGGPAFTEDNSSGSNSDDFSNHPDNGDWNNPDASPRHGGRRLVIYVIIIILIIFGAFWFLGNRNTTAPSPSANNTTITPSTSADQNSNSTSSLSSSIIKVSDQPASGVVTIDSVTLNEPAWIAIEEDRDGERGNVLGALWLPAGTHTDQSVDLLRFTSAGGKYYTVVRADYGDDHLFDIDKDEPLANSSGSPIMSVFHAVSEE